MNEHGCDRIASEMSGRNGPGDAVSLFVEGTVVAAQGREAEMLLLVCVLVVMQLGYEAK